MHFLKKLSVKLKMYPFSQEKGKQEPFKRTQTRKGSTEMEILVDKTVLGVSVKSIVKVIIGMSLYYKLDQWLLTFFVGILPMHGHVRSTAARQIPNSVLYK